VPLARLLSNGLPDPTFGDAGLALLPSGAPTLIGGLTALLRQPDGKLIAGGTSRAEFALTRFRANGRIDATFGSGGTVVTGAGPGGSRQSGPAQVLALFRQPDGKIIAGGEATSRQALARLTARGRLDRGFGNRGTLITRRPNNLVFDQAVRWMFSAGAGRLITGGTLRSTRETRFDIARFRTR